MVWGSLGRGLLAGDPWAWAWAWAWGLARGCWAWGVGWRGGLGLKTQCLHDGFRKHCFEASLHGSQKRGGGGGGSPPLFAELFYLHSSLASLLPCMAAFFLASSFPSLLPSCRSFFLPSFCFLPLPSASLCFLPSFRFLLLPYASFLPSASPSSSFPVSLLFASLILFS